MNGPLLWVHDEGLHPVTAGFSREPRPVAALYVFDEDKLRREAWSRARIGLIYESLLDLPITILRGDPVACILQKMGECGANYVATVRPIDPALLFAIEELRQSVKVELFERPTFLPEPVSVLDLRRFSRYWQRARPLLLGDTTSKSSRVAGG